MPLPLGTPGPSQPTTGVTVGDTVGSNTGMGFGLHEPPKMRKALNKNGEPMTGKEDEGQQSGESNSGSDSTGSSVSASKSNTDNHSHHGHSSSAPRGTLSVKVISARGLAVSHAPEANPQPYVVIQFEQNEFYFEAAAPCCFTG